MIVELKVLWSSKFEKDENAILFYNLNIKSVNKNNTNINIFHCPLGLQIIIPKGGYRITLGLKVRHFC